MTRPLLAATAAALLLTACGGGSSSTAQAGVAPSAPDAVASAGGTATATSSAPAAAPSAQAAGSAAPGTTAPPAAVAQAPAPAAAPRTGSSAPVGTAPGTYTYDSSGTVTAGTAHQVNGTPTLTVDPAQAGRQHSVLAGDQGRTVQDVLVRSDGTYLTRLTISNPAFTKEFAPPTPVLLVPAPARPGRSWSWTATSTDGKTTAAVTARVVRTETVTVGGSAVVCAVVESTLRLTGDITYTGRTTTWYDPAHRLNVKDHTQGNGTVSGFAFSTDLTNVLRSLRPR